MVVTVHGHARCRGRVNEHATLVHDEQDVLETLRDAFGLVRHNM